MAGTYHRFAELGTSIYSVAVNYWDHAAELGNALPEKPLLFMKPAKAYITQGQLITAPIGSRSLYPEIGFGIIIGQKATKVSEAKAMDYVAGYALALDITAIDFQNYAKELGYAWEMSKAFDSSCPVSEFIPKSAVADLDDLTLWCKINGKLKQSGNTKDMMFKIPYLLSYISQYFTLQPYDMIITGTPAGACAVYPGDMVQGDLHSGGDTMLTCRFKVGDPQE